MALLLEEKNCPQSQPTLTLDLRLRMKINRLLTLNTKLGHGSKKSEDAKYAEVEKLLKSLMFDCKRQEEKIANQAKILDQCKKDIENCAYKAIKQLVERHERFRQVELNIFEEEVDKVNHWKADQLRIFDKETSHLDLLKAHQQDVANKGNSLLKDIRVPDFISQSEILLKNKLTELQAVPTWEPILSQEASQWPIFSSPDFRNNVKEYILGSIVPESRTSERHMAGLFPRTGSIHPITQLMPTLTKQT